MEAETLPIGFKIRKFRELAGLKQDYVANELGITQTAYSLIENGKTKVTEERLEQIAEVLGVTPEIIRNWEDVRNFFFQCTHSGNYNTYHGAAVDVEQVAGIYKILIKSLESRIEDQVRTIEAKDELIGELKKQLSQT
jgi:transcriptional regulator with XRE-family HTH domain